jgi:hypothetical protein
VDIAARIEPSHMGLERTQSTKNTQLNAALTRWRFCLCLKLKQASSKGRLWGCLLGVRIPKDEANKNTSSDAHPL